MTENRRAAVRVTSGEPGRLEFSGRAAQCVVLDVSATAARVHLSPPQLIPDRVVLVTKVAGQPVTLAAQVWRAEPGMLLALVFTNPEDMELHRLIADAQRREIRRGIRPSAERRRSQR